MRKTSFLMAFLAIATFASAKTWRVNPNATVSADFHSITEAVADENVVKDDILYLEAGYYDESPNITKAITLMGPGWGIDADTLNINCAEITGSIRLSHDSITITGVKCNNEIYTNSSTIQYITIERCYLKKTISVSNYATIKNNFLYYDYTTISVGTNSIITGNLIIGYNTTGIAAGNFSFITNNTCYTRGFGIEATNSTIKDNIVIASSSNGPIYPMNSNTVTNNVLSTTESVTGYTNNSYAGATIDNSFVKTGEASLPAYYQVLAGNVAKTASSTESECGAFGGAEPFILGCRPVYLPYIYDLNVPTAASGNTLNISFKAKVQNE